MEKEKVIIIGGGIAGLTAGVYLLDNGYDVEIYEKHFIAGGECTGWNRSNVHIDGCAHWIVGTNPKDEIFDVWKHIGAFDEHTKIFNTDYLAKFDVDGKTYTFYTDLNKLKQELLSISKEDKHMINSLIRHIKINQHTLIPVVKPIDMMNIFELTKFGFNFIPMLYSFNKYSQMTIKNYAQKFKSKIIQDILIRWMFDDYKMSSFLYVLQEASQNNAGMVEGGSLAMAKRIVAKFKSLGGKLFCNKEVNSLLIDGKIVKGVKFKNGDEVFADYIVAACDIHHTFYDLLENKYTPKYFSKRFEDRENYQLNCSFLLSYKIKKNIDEYPKMMDYRIPEINILSQKINHFQIRNYAFDKSISNGKDNLITILLPAKGDVYENLEKLSDVDYKKEKENIGNIFKNIVIEKMGLKEDEIELIDVTTPLTYNRYLNAYKGSYMAFVNSVKNKGLMTKGTIKGLDNFILASQWLMSPGGLPIAVMMGKHAAIRICKKSKKKFINKEEKKNSKMINTANNNLVVNHN